MAAKIKNIIPRKQAEAAITAQYTAPSSTRCVITKFTGTNTSGADASLTVYLIASGGTADNSNTVSFQRTIAAGEAYTFPELINQILESDGFISTLASAASSITISASGTEVTV